MMREMLSRAKMVQDLLPKAEEAGIDLRKPYRVKELFNGTVLFEQEVEPASDRPESEPKVLRVVLRDLRRLGLKPA